ncbi:unnamed protein product [Calicophoron daubneyi]|uniref:DM14 domain-containing protein n=1 Tax=Calicophoron daubneyi TaxID=300641 RepID=A0AAV2TIM2_CALDB
MSSNSNDESEGFSDDPWGHVLHKMYNRLYPEDSDLEKELEGLVQENGQPDNNERNTTDQDPFDNAGNEGAVPEDSTKTAKDNFSVPKAPIIKDAAGPDSCKSSQDQAHSESPANSTLINLLRKRQNELKLAAYQAKQIGDIDCAKNHLRYALSINSLIKCTEEGGVIERRRIPTKPVLNEPRCAITGMKTSCTPPGSFISEVKHERDDDDHLAVLTCYLKKQEMELRRVIDEQQMLGCAELVDYFSCMAQAFHDKRNLLQTKQLRPVSETFCLIQVPRVNRNWDVEVNTLEVCASWLFVGSPHWNESPTEFQDCFAEFELACSVLSRIQKRTGSLQNFVGHICRGFSVEQFRVNTRHWFHARCMVLRATIYCRWKSAEGCKTETIESIYIPLKPLLQSATIENTYFLDKNRGYVVMRIRQRAPVNGSCVINQKKRWLFVNLGENSDGSAPAVESDSPETAGRSIRTDAATDQRKLPKADFNPAAPVADTNVSASKANLSQVTPHSNKDSFSTAPVRQPPIQDTGENKTNELPKYLASKQHYSEGKPSTSRSSSDCSGQDLKFHSRALLLSRKSYHSTRLRDLGISDEARKKHFAEIQKIDSLINSLDKRLSGPNAKNEKIQYVKNLESLLVHLTELCHQATIQKNMPRLAGHQYEMKIVHDEIESLK